MNGQFQQQFCSYAVYAFPSSIRRTGFSSAFEDELARDELMDRFIDRLHANDLAHLGYTLESINNLPSSSSFGSACIVANIFIRQGGHLKPFDSVIVTLQEWFRVCQEAIVTFEWIGVRPAAIN